MQIDLFKGKTGKWAFPSPPSGLSPGEYPVKNCFVICYSPVGLWECKLSWPPQPGGVTAGWQLQKPGHQTCAKAPFRETLVTWIQEKESGKVVLSALLVCREGPSQPLHVCEIEAGPSDCGFEDT